jgi:hypothetical protein
MNNNCMPANSAALSVQRFNNGPFEAASTPPENCPALVLEMRTFEYDTAHSRSVLSLRLKPCAYVSVPRIHQDRQCVLCIGYDSRELKSLDVCRRLGDD